MSDINEPNTGPEKLHPKLTVLVVAHDDGSVDIISANGKVKHRKGQSEEAFQKELTSFHSSGPRRNEPGHLMDSYEAELAKYNAIKHKSADEIKKELTLFEVTNKPKRAQLVYTAELQYFHRNYKKLMEICDQIMELFELYGMASAKRETAEVLKIKQHCEKKLGV